jgi:TRAP-type transport system periplasmic protein
VTITATRRTKAKGLLAFAVPLMLAAGAADAQQLRLATVVTAPHPWIDAAQAFEAEVEKATEGRVTVEVFPGGQLGNDQTVIDEMRIGTIDMIIGGTQNASPFVRKLEIFSLNYMFDGMDSFRKATDPEGPVFQYFTKEFEDAGIGLKLLAFTGGGTRNLSTGPRPVTSPGDVEGLRMRVPGSQMDARMWQAVGALTTSLPWTEIYTGVQTGVVDAFESTISGYFGSKLYEVAPYHAKTEHQIMMSHISIGEPSFERLSDEDKAIVVQAARNAAELGTTQGEQYDRELLERLQKEHGVTVSEVEKPAFIAATAPLHDEFAQQLGATDVLETIRGLQ